MPILGILFTTVLGILAFDLAHAESPTTRELAGTWSADAIVCTDGASRPTSPSIQNLTELTIDGVYRNTIETKSGCSVVRVGLYTVNGDQIQVDTTTAHFKGSCMFTSNFYEPRSFVLQLASDGLHQQLPFGPQTLCPATGQGTLRLSPVATSHEIKD